MSVRNRMSKAALPAFGAFGLLVWSSCEGYVRFADSSGSPHVAGEGGGSAVSGSSVSVATASSTSTGDVAPEPPFEGWSALRGVPSYCEIYVADDPSQVPPPSWAPCDDGAAGCQDLVVDWAPPEREYRFYIDLGGGVPGTGPVIILRRRLGYALSGWADMLMTYVDGPVIAAFRGRDPMDTDEPCAVVRPAVGGGRALAAVSDRSESPSPAEYQVEVPLLGGAPTVYNVLTKEHMTSGWGGLRSAGDTFVAIEIQPGPDIMKVAYDGSPPTPILWGSLHEPTGERPIVVGRDTFYTADTGTQLRVDVHHDASGATEPLIAPEDADVYGFQTDGKTLIWQQAYPMGAHASDAVRFELWRSPYAATPDKVVPEKVADLPLALWNSETYLENGLLVLRKQRYTEEDVWWSSNIIVRLSDWTAWTVDAPPGMWWGNVTYAGLDEIALPVQPPWKQSSTTTVRRQKLSALKPPRPLAELLDELSRGGGR